VDLDGARLARREEPPHRLQQLVAGDDLPRVTEQVLEQVELALGELDLASIDPDLASGARQRDRSEGDDRLLAAARARPSQDGLDPRGQLARRERLGDIVVGSDLEPGDAIGHVVTGREHDHRHLATDPAAHLEPVDSGQPDVEHDQRDRMPAELRQGVLPRPHPQDLVAIALEVGADQRADVRLVLDDHDFRRHRRIVGAPRRSARRALHTADVPLTVPFHRAGTMFLGRIGKSQSQEVRRT